MRATIRLADGSLVEGEVVSIGYKYASGAAAGCAGNPSVVYDMQIPTAAAIVPLRYFPSTSAAPGAAVPCGVLVDF